jgi:hypothetical protein
LTQNGDYNVKAVSSQQFSASDETPPGHATNYGSKTGIVKTTEVIVNKEKKDVTIPTGIDLRNSISVSPSIDTSINIPLGQPIGRPRDDQCWRRNPMGMGKVLLSVPMLSTRI